MQKSSGSFLLSFSKSRVVTVQYFALFFFVNVECFESFGFDVGKKKRKSNV